MPKSDAGPDLEELLVGRGCSHLPPEAKNPGRIPQQNDVPRRVRGSNQHEPLRGLRKPFEPPPEALFELSGEISHVWDCEAAREFCSGPTLREFQ
jgi:hypothetical protein